MPALRSMTGFARTRRSLGDGEISVTVKSVNHRGLDVQVRGPESLDSIETSVRSLVKSQVHRGHVEVRISLPGAGPQSTPPAINHPLLEAYLKTFREACARYALNEEPDLNAALRLPGMFVQAEDTGLPEGTGAAVLEALADALHQMNAFREREGAEIGMEMYGHNVQIADAAQEMERIRAGATQAFQTRLTDRLADLLKGAQIEPQRLAQEAALLAERSDIGEELARLKIHSAQLASLLDEGGEVGKKLDFLLQEMNRETNTILSKTGGAGDAGLRLTERALSCKASIEKIREQALNLE
ncbi:MAG TPA: YicC/YloC family endoribonuclease [Bryobacteraceae bacterium]|jgi:uncharacterized protein (TIGR00255 family)